MISSWWRGVRFSYERTAAARILAGTGVFASDSGSAVTSDLWPPAAASAISIRSCSLSKSAATRFSMCFGTPAAVSET